MNLLDTLGLIFIVLKLAGLVTWSWWFVLSPYFIMFALFIIKYALIGISEIRTAKAAQNRRFAESVNKLEKDYTNVR